MARGYFRAAFESIPGAEGVAPTLSTKTIFVPVISTKADLAPEHLSRDDELRGVDEPLAMIPESYTPSWEKTVRGYPDSLGFFLKAMLGEPVSTAGDGTITDPAGVPIPTGATRHAWAAPFYQGDHPQTFEGIWAYVDQSVFFRLAGCAASAMEFETPDTGGMSVKVSGPGMFMERIADPSHLPAYESLAVRPFLKSGLTLQWLSGHATVQDFALSCEAPVEATRTLGNGSKFPDLMEKGEGLITWTGSVNSRQVDADDWDALLNATGFAALAAWRSDSIVASGYPYKLFARFSNCQLTGGDVEELSNKRRIGASSNFKATTAGSTSAEIVLVNATADYS